MRVPCLAATAALGFFLAGPAQAKPPVDDYKKATWEDMHVGDERGYLTVREHAQRFLACTQDEHLVTTYVFATALRRDAAVTAMADIDAYLLALKSAFAKQSRHVTARVFDAMNHYPLSLPQSIVQRLEEASESYNTKKQTNLNWMLRAFMTSETPHQACLELHGNP